MRIGIFVVHHKEPAVTLDNDIFIPIYLQNDPEQACPRYPVANPDHIMDHKSYGELRAHYYVWKNLLDQFDYIGFQHYRRSLVWPFSPLGSQPQILSDLYHRSHNAPFHYELKVPPEEFISYFDALQNMSFWDQRKIRDLIESHDVIIPVKNTGNISEIYAMYHDKKDWDILIEEMHREPLFKSLKDHMIWNPDWAYYCNVFVMKTDIFREYAKTIFPIMERVEARVEIPDDPYQMRVVGFLGERLLTYFMSAMTISAINLRARELKIAFSPAL